MAVVYTTLRTKDQWEEINKYLPLLCVEDTQAILAYNIKEELLGAMVFDNWTDTSVHAHFLLRKPMLLRHGFFEVCFGYVFGQSGRDMMYTIIPGNNDKSRRLVKRLGATEKCILEGAFKKGEDMVLVELRKENCKYLGGD
jgi:hypothetical protein